MALDSDSGQFHFTDGILDFDFLVDTDHSLAGLRSGLRGSGVGYFEGLGFQAVVAAELSILF